MNKYQELKSNQEKRLSEFIKEGMFFAFSNEQFKEGMQKFGLDEKKDLDKIYSYGSGGFLLKEKSEKMHKLANEFEKELQEKIDADKDGLGFIYDMFRYELENHEYGYTYEFDDTLDALDLTIEDIKKSKTLSKGFIKAVKDIEDYENSKLA